MKNFKLLTVLIFLISLAVSCKKENALSKVNKENVEKANERNKLSHREAKIAFDNDTYEFGTVNEGDVIKHAFLVTNTGDGDLIISNATASCGCTIPTWPKEAIAPKESAQIFVEFDTEGKTNFQSKAVRLTTNTVIGKESLKVTGMVIPREKQ